MLSLIHIYGKVAVAGGVAANSRIRADLERACRASGHRLYLPALSPVSYTHLDVYKRQVHSFLIDFQTAQTDCTFGRNVIK